MKFNPLGFAGRLLQGAGNELLKVGSLKGIWIDVGAHYGEVTLEVAINNPGLTIYAFEPNLRAASRLLGRAPNYVVIPMGITETDGSCPFYVNSCDSASSVLKMDEAARLSWKGGEALREESAMSIVTIRLDTFMSMAGISRVDLLKIDTQGNDLAVVRSAGQRIRDICKITLEVDVSPQRLYQGSPSKEEILTFLNAAGFRLISTERQSYEQEENLTFECSSSQ